MIIYANITIAANHDDWQAVITHKRGVVTIHAEDMPRLLRLVHERLSALDSE